MKMEMEILYAEKIGGGNYEKSTKIVHINRRKSIRNKCLDCSDYSAKEVTNCKFTDCQIYDFRSGKGTQDPKARSKAIRMYCLKECMIDQSYEVKLCPSVDCPLYPFRHTKIDKTHLLQKMAA